jgi:hypothetical protein
MALNLLKKLYIRGRIHYYELIIEYNLTKNISPCKKICRICN